MRTKQIKVDGQEVEAVLMAGGSGFKIYSIPGKVLVVAGKEKKSFSESDPEFKTVMAYVNLKYQSNQDEIKSKFEEFLKSLQNKTEASAVKDISKHLDDLNDKLYAKMGGMKATSKLKKKGQKSNIPGFGYYFKAN